MNTSESSQSETVLVLRVCKPDLSSYSSEARGFKWPESGPVEAPDWDSTPVCGGGLHGFLWGAGNVCKSGADWAFANTDDARSAKWLVVEVLKSSIVDLSEKVKFPRGEVVFCGGLVDAAKVIAERAPIGTPIIGGTATAGVRGTATAGDSGTATAGDSGTATAGDGGTATAGVRGTATAGVRGTATAGVRGTATAGYGGTATAGDSGTATAGYGGTATAGDGGTATAGVRGTATAGDSGTATAGDRGTATAGVRGTATAGDSGTLSILYWDAKREKYRHATVEVGEDGIEPNTAYVLDVNYKFVKKV